MKTKTKTKTKKSDGDGVTRIEWPAGWDALEGWPDPVQMAGAPANNPLDRELDRIRRLRPDLFDSVLETMRADAEEQVMERDGGMWVPVRVLTRHSCNPRKGPPIPIRDRPPGRRDH